MKLLAPSALMLAAAALVPVDEAAAEGNCTTIDIALQPALSTDASANKFPPQIVAWIEDEQGNYKDTVFLTQSVGRHGIGNRPGRWDFNSGPRWPYGRRITTFPVWAHRHGLVFPEVIFQNGDEDNLSHPSMESTADPKYCAPLMREEPEWDTGTCATTGYTDKGTFGPSSEARYPPRQDIIRMEYDAAAVEMYDMLNPFDAVSQPTPALGEIAKLLYAVPEEIGPGNYVMWIEVSKEFDMNGMYNPDVFPPPADIPWETYGLPYRGQPSVLYKVPFRLDGAEPTTSTTLEYVGYGDPTGSDGEIRPPDSTITANSPGSGSSRLQIISENGDMYRVKVLAKPEQDFTPPAAPGELMISNLESTKVTFSFVAPGDDGTTGKVARYEVRIRAGEPITAENFESSQLATVMVVPEDGGLTQELTIDRLLWETDYSIGIRAMDNCRNVGELATYTFRTPEREVGSVDACFIATAAYGSALANDVEELRSFRDVFLRRSIFGELATEAYYTFGPTVSGVIAESDLARTTTREALAPLVAAVKRILH